MKKDVVLCKDCVYYRHKIIKSLHDETKTEFDGYVCGYFNHVISASHYCSIGKEKVSIDKTSEERKAKIIEKIKTGQELLDAEKQELFFIDPFSSLFKDNIVDIIPSRKVRDLFLSDISVILKFDDELYAIDWEWKRDTYNAIVYWEGTKLYKVRKVRKVKKDRIGVEYEPIENIKIGDKVMIKGSAEEEVYKGCVFEVLSDPYTVCGEELVQMKCHETGKYFAGGYATVFLEKVNS